MTLITTNAAAAALMALARNTDDEGLTAGQMVQIDQLVAKAGDGAWYGAFSPSRECMSLKQGNQLAQIVLDARAAGNDPEFVLAQSGLLARDDAWAYARDAARALLTDYDDDLLDLTRRQYGDLLDALTFRIEDDIAGKDTSRARDALSSFDRCELLFVFQRPEQDYLDGAIESYKPWPDWRELCVTSDLAHSLACLGYSVSQYRKASANRHVSQPDRGQSRLTALRPDRKVAPICSMDAIAEMVDNSCSTYFIFCAYAIVPVVQLLDLDPAQPVTFSKAAIATWNPWSGTFHDAAKAHNLTVKPAMGKFVSPARFYSPDDICGFVQRYYEADIRQALHA